MHNQTFFLLLFFVTFSHDIGQTFAQEETEKVSIVKSTPKYRLPLYLINPSTFKDFILTIVENVEKLKSSFVLLQGKNRLCYFRFQGQKSSYSLPTGLSSVMKRFSYFPLVSSFWILVWENKCWPFQFSVLGRLPRSRMHLLLPNELSGNELFFRLGTGFEIRLVMLREETRQIFEVKVWIQRRSWCWSPRF